MLSGGVCALETQSLHVRAVQWPMRVVQNAATKIHTCMYAEKMKPDWNACGRKKEACRCAGQPPDMHAGEAWATCLYLPQAYIRPFLLTLPLRIRLRT